jgi:hypothetical protein
MFHQLIFTSLLWLLFITQLNLLLCPLQGHVCGLCGNYDGNANNDFTTRSQAVVVNPLDFGNSWKVSASCPDAKNKRSPCTANPYRQSWSQKQCSIIQSKVFTDCHSKVGLDFSRSLNVLEFDVIMSNKICFPIRWTPLLSTMLVWQTRVLATVVETVSVSVPLWQLMQRPVMRLEPA